MKTLANNISNNNHRLGIETMPQRHARKVCWGTRCLRCKVGFVRLHTFLGPHFASSRQETEEIARSQRAAKPHLSEQWHAITCLHASQVAHVPNKRMLLELQFFPKCVQAHAYRVRVLLLVPRITHAWRGRRFATRNLKLNTRQVFLQNEYIHDTNKFVKSTPQT